MIKLIFFKNFFQRKYTGKIAQHLSCLVKIMFLVSISLTSLTSLAQNKNSDNLEGELIIKKKQKVTLPIVEKERTKMQLPNKKKNKIEQHYNFKKFLTDFSPLNLDIEYAMPGIKKEEEKIETQTNYINAGIGNFGTSYFEGFYSTKTTKNTYGVLLKHLASKTGAVRSEESGSGHNQAKIFASHYTPDGEIFASFGYQRNLVNLYGFENEINQTREAAQQTFNLIEGNILFQKKSIFAKTNFTTNASFYRLSDNLYNNSEYNFNLNGDLSLTINDNSRIIFGGDILFNQFKNEENLTRNLYSGSATYNLSKDKLSIKAGISFAHNSDISHTDKKFNIYPDFKVTFKILEDKLSAFGMIGGGAIQKTYNDFIRENPFVSNNLDLAHANSKINFSAGLQVKPNQYINIKTTASYNTIENLHFFVNNISDPATFDIIYDNEDINLISFKTEALLSVTNFKTILVSELYRYNTNSLEEAWHKPSIKTQLTLMYNDAYNRFLLSADFMHLGGIKAKDFGKDETYNLNAIFDLGLKAEYTPTKNSGYIRSPRKWSLFLKLNNILSSQYERYLYYPVRGINAVVGVTYNF